MRPLVVLALCASLTACSSYSPAAVNSPTPVTTPTPAVTSDQHQTAAPTQGLDTRMTAALDITRSRANAYGMLALVNHGAAQTWTASGNADAQGSAIVQSTRFRVGSVTKPIIGALTLMAVRDGLIGLEDTVEEVLPGVLRKDPPVTVRQLLDHTSGIFDEGNEGDPVADVALISDPQIRADAEELLRAYQDGQAVRLTDVMWIALAETHERYNAPGSASHYSNVNYQVLGMILEHQTGKPLAELLRSQVTEPLGLTRTGLAPSDATTPEMHGFDTTRDGTMLDVTDDTMWFGNGGNGGVYSTAGELLTIIHAIVSGDLLPDDLKAEMRKPHLAPYGLGLATYTLTCGTFYGHGGSVLGTQSIALVSQDGSDGVVAAINIVSDADPRLPALADTLLCMR